MSLLEKLKKNSTIKQSEILTDSKIMLEKDVISTSIPALNIALSGNINGGLTSGLTVFAGESKRFKSLFSLILAESYLKKYPESMLLFYDNEFGSPIAYFESVGIDPSRVFHSPIESIEQLRTDISNQLEGINRGDKVIIVVDSVGNLASNKEKNDALEDKNVADMTRAKTLKSLFRIVTPQLTIKDIPMVVIGHTYKTQEMYSKDVVSGGTGIYYSAQNIYIIGRQQEKEGTELKGYKFIINAEKSRFIKEKSRIPIDVSFEGGMNKYSGLMDIAIELGFAVKPKNGWYAKVNIDTGEVSETNHRLSQTNNDEFWNDILNNEKFIQAVEQKYQYKNKNILTESENIDQVYEDEQN